MSKWQPIETAPKDGIPILVCEGADVNVAYWRNGRWEGSWQTPSSGWNDYEEVITVSPTHWMPLPEPPKVS